MSIPHDFNLLGLLDGWKRTPGVMLSSTESSVFVNFEKPLIDDVLEIEADFSSCNSWATLRYNANGITDGILGIQCSLSNTTFIFYNAGLETLTKDNVAGLKGFNRFRLEKSLLYINSTSPFYTLLRDEAKINRIGFLGISRFVKIQYIRLIRNGVDVARYVPYTHTNGEVRLFDEVTKQFLTKYVS